MKKKFLVAVFAILFAVSGIAFALNFGTLSAAASTSVSGGGIYTYTYNGQVYESEISEEDAWSSAMLDQLQQGNITMQDIESDYSVLGSRDIIEDIPLYMPMSSGTSLTGRAEWQPNATAAYLPLQRVKVELYMHWGNFAPLKVDETYTTDNGNYTFDNFSLWEELAIIGFGPVWAAVYQTYSVRIYPESETFRVAKDWAGVTLLDEVQKWSLGLIPNFLAYYVSSSTGTWFWQSSGNFGTMKIPYSTTNDTHKSFYISQALVMGQRFVQDVRRVNLSMFVTAMYPFVDDEAFCFAGLMGIGGDRDGDGIGDRFDDWETVLHEYGHFVQHNVGTNDISLIDYALYNPTHFTTSDHTASTANGGKGNKSYGIRLAWTEAWATAFAMITIDHYAIGYYASGQTLVAAGIQNTNGDLNYYSAFPASTYGSLENMSEGQEDAIIAFLWNLYRQPFFGQNGFWNTTTISGTYSLSNLVNTLNTQYSECRSQIGALMGSFKIAPQILTSTYTPGSSAPPTITWRVNGSQNNPNNQFRIAFYNLDGVQKYETGNVSFTLTPAAAPNQNRRDLNVASYTLTQQGFNNALSNFVSGETIHIAVKGYRTGSPVTGPYWSATIPEIPESLALSQLVFTSINNGNEYSVTNILDKQFTGLVRIPSTYNGKPVTQIGASAFANSGMSQITIPASVAAIGSHAFRNCTNLGIGEDAISFPKSVTSIGSFAFVNCARIKRIIFSKDSQLQNISSYAFYGCRSLISVELPGSLTSVGAYAFYGGSGIEITWRYNPALDISQFSNYLTAVIIPEDVRYIADNAFSVCTSLVSVSFELGSQLQRIGASAFNGCTNLITNIKIPDSVTNIESFAFFGCSGLTSITLPDGLIVIGDSAFYGCSGLTKIVLPASVTSIGERAFQNCSGLTSFELNSNITRIEASTFSNCSGLTSFAIPAGITKIGIMAFENCTALKTISIERSSESGGIISLGAWCFNNCNSLSTIYVPDAASVTSYKNAQSWQGYQSIIKEYFIATEELSYILITSSDSYEVYADTPFLSGVVYIPALYNGKPVTGIANRGFASSGISGVVIQGGTEGFKIGDNAFEFCDNLEFIILTEGTTGIMSYVFLACGNLTSIVIPSGVTVIDTYAFYWCGWLSDGFTLYAETESAPAGWGGIWVSYEYPIVWGSTLSADKTYVVSVKKSTDHLFNYINDPYRIGYTFGGWSTTPGGTTACALNSVPADSVLYAIWIFN